MAIVLLYRASSVDCTFQPTALPALATRWRSYIQEVVQLCGIWGVLVKLIAYSVAVT